MKPRRIALLINANRAVERDLLAGIAAYLAGTRVAWDLFLEEDFRLRLDGIDQWQGDGIIADFDDPAVARALQRSRVPVVAVGGSYADADAYPAGVPYVATDNAKLVKLARDHLIESGLRRFAMFSLPAMEENRWAQERERAFRSMMEAERQHTTIFRGHATHAATWDEAVDGQIAWLRSLPKPVGIVAVNDARACQLMQACQRAGIDVPGEVALVGIDNDPLVGALAPVALSSVIQGAREVGRSAAHLLDRMLAGMWLGDTRILVPPAGIQTGASCRRPADLDPRLMRARYFIDRFACRGIRTAQVADYVGLSRSSLETLVRRQLGCSVHEVVLRARIEAAKASLERGASVADVALACGFGSPQYMHRVFKRELGDSPCAWRAGRT